jgi:hypothetical protein
MTNRRTFIKTTALTGLGMVAVNSLSASNLSRKKTTTPLFAEKSIILFQGDSITDGNRGRNDDWNHVLGHELIARQWLKCVATSINNSHR